MREWRKTHPLSKEQRLKADVRSKVKMRLRRRLMKKQPCEVCGSKTNLEAHHDDYSKPYDVRWLCRIHHNEHHRNMRCV